MKTKAFILRDLLLTLLYLPKYPKLDFSDYGFMNEYIYTQSEAMASRSKKDLNHEANAAFSIYFHESGNVNQAQSIMGEMFKMVIHLGNGYLTYEK